MWPFSMHCWFDGDDDGFHNGTVSDILLFNPSTKNWLWLNVYYGEVDGIRVQFALLYFILLSHFLVLYLNIFPTQ